MAANDSKDAEPLGIFALWMKHLLDQSVTGMDEMMKCLFLHEFLCSELSSAATRGSGRANWTLLIQLHENKHSSETGISPICLKQNTIPFYNF